MGGLTGDLDSFARKLVEEGYCQISSRYRRVAKLPPGKTGKEAVLESLLGKNPKKWEVEHYTHLVSRWSEAEAKDHFLRVFAGKGLTLKLTHEEFLAYKKAGGGTAR